MAYAVPTIYKKTYDKFKGVDFTTDPSKVEDCRSPYALNMTFDSGGMPEKRLGWRVLRAFSDGKVNGIFSAVLQGYTYYFAHVGTKLYVWGGSLNFSIDDALSVNNAMADSKSTFFYAYTAKGVNDVFVTNNNAVFILDGLNFLYFTGTVDPLSVPSNPHYEGAYSVENSAYVPVTSHARTPSGGSSTAQESVNLLTNKRINKFNGDNLTLTYKLDATIVTVISIYVGGVLTTDYTVNASAGTITFSTFSRPATGVDNVVIKFEASNDTTKPKMYNCTISCLLTVGALDNRIVLSGNTKFKNYEFISAYNEPLYFPENSFNVIGTPNTAIKGYLNMGSNQVVLKASDTQSPTIFIRSYTTDENKKTVFLIQQGCVGNGAISSKCMDNLNGEPLFLTENGVFGIAQSDITRLTSMQNRSYHIDSRLLKEEGLQNAVSVVHKGCFYIFINEHVYILDGIQEKVYRAESIGDYAYECFYWEDVPAVTAYANNDTIYFGTSDGKVCRFNTDITTLGCYNDYLAADMLSPRAVHALWSTKLDTDGFTGRYKTLMKNGTSVTIKPYTHSSVEILARTDEFPLLHLNFGYSDLMEWDSMGFARCSFNVNEMPTDISVNKKIQKFRYLQFIVENCSLNEGFGVYAITKYYVLGNYAK